MWMFWVPIAGLWDSPAMMARDEIVEGVVRRVGGITVLDGAHGLWVSPSTGNTVRENVELWLVEGLTEQEARDVAGQIRTGLDQESVLWGRLGGEFQLCGAEPSGRETEPVPGWEGGTAGLGDSVERGGEAPGGGTARGQSHGAAGEHGGREGDREYSAVGPREGENGGRPHREGLSGGWTDVGIVGVLSMGGVAAVWGCSLIWRALNALW